MGSVTGRVFSRSEKTGEVNVYLVDDPILPAAEHYFLVLNAVYIDGCVQFRWQGYHGPVECYDGLAGGDLQEAFEQALSHYLNRQEGEKK